jgi:fibronectin type 3 domain-containing protein
MAVKHAPRLLLVLIAVFALTATGCGNDSSTPASPTLDTAPPAVPGGAAAWGQVGSTSKIHISWDANVTDADLAGYVLYRSEAPDLPFRPVSRNLVNGNAYEDTDVQQGHTYCYRVAARDASGNESGLSRQIEIQLDSTQVTPNSTKSDYDF